MAFGQTTDGRSRSWGDAPGYGEYGFWPGVQPANAQLPNPRRSSGFFPFDRISGRSTTSTSAGDAAKQVALRMTYTAYSAHFE